MTDAQWETASAVVRVNKLGNFAKDCAQSARMDDGVLIMVTALGTFAVFADGILIER